MMSSSRELLFEQPMTGTWVALPTPFAVDGGLDISAFQNVVKRCVDNGVDGLVPLGTTGEAVTVTESERADLIGACLELAGDLPVVVGAGSNDTQTAARWAAEARSLGANGALVVTPYYNRPNRDGLLAHYAEVQDRCPDLPLVAYNVPSRTGLDMGVELMLELLEMPSVVAVKESSGRLDQMSELARCAAEGTSVLAGDDAFAVPAIALGARGLVSVAANVRPNEVVRMVTAALNDRGPQALRIHQELEPLMRALFSETNPVPLKAAMAILGLMNDGVRLPLWRASQETTDELASVLGSLARVAS